jgi:topoisomerase IV subunit B
MHLSRLRSVPVHFIRRSMSDLFAESAASNDYTAADIEVLEGLEAVRRRPGMYVGGADERAYHHLAAEILDNSMDEAVEGHADLILVELTADGFFQVRDNGRGIPIDPHPKNPKQSALEVILTTLHSGGKFSGKNYATSGGLHGVGMSVVNALSEALTVEVARDKTLWRQTYSKGAPTSKLEKAGAAPNRRGTQIRFRPDPEIFGDRLKFSPARLYRMARSKAYLFKGVKIRWKCDPSLLKEGEETPAEAELQFPGGLQDFLAASIGERPVATDMPFAGDATMSDGGRVEWALSWPVDGDDGFTHSYCNTIPTPLGGSHENGFRTALLRGLKNYGEFKNVKKAAQITGDDVVGASGLMLSCFIKDPQFQGQTKERLETPDAQRAVEAAIKDRFESWLTSAPANADALLEHVIERTDDRLRRRAERDVKRKTATSRKLRLPGKLADCSLPGPEGCELFLVEGDSAGGSAKQARNRKTQAILPLRGKILNVANATVEKMRANLEVQDILLALGCGSGKNYDHDKLRYERIIIMTDADVDGAHIAALLMTFFFQEMPQLIERGGLFLAQPPLFRLSAGGETHYAKDDAHREELLATTFKSKKKVDISRFKGLGEMPPTQLRDTTMALASRTLLQVTLTDAGGEQVQGLEGRRDSSDLVDRLMGKKPETRLAFIQENAKFAQNLDI